MNINAWLIENKGITIRSVRNMCLTEKEWSKICREYEQYCKRIHQKVDYGLFDDECYGKMKSFTNSKKE